VHMQLMFDFFVALGFEFSLMLARQTHLPLKPVHQSCISVVMVCCSPIRATSLLPLFPPFHLMSRPLSVEETLRTRGGT
jgi:hypothetical protein